MKSKSVADTILPWLKANLGNRCTAPLTGTDVRALKAAVQILELYSVDRDDAVLEAFRIAVDKMQASTRELAYHAIAHILEWDDRRRIWALLFDAIFVPASRCKFEPKAYPVSGFGPPMETDIPAGNIQEDEDSSLDPFPH